MPGGSGSDGGGKGGGKDGKDGAGPPKFVMKFLMPEVLASAIIGKGGAIIAAMRQSCQAKLALTEHGQFYPHTDCRVLTSSTGSEESLADVIKQVVAKLDELVTSTPSEALGAEDELKIRAIVPRFAVGGLIGKGGASIKQLRESSGAKISITDAVGSGPAAEQTVAVTGTSQALEAVLTEVSNQIQLLNGESWFSSWAATSGATWASSGDWGGDYANWSSSGGDWGWDGDGGAVGGGGWEGGWESHGGSHPGVDLMMSVSQSMPPYVMEDSRGFAMSCTVPYRLVGGLIGRGGSGTKEVQQATGTKISIRELPNDPDNRTLNIVGPLPNTCAAYMLMMKRYLDAESQSPAK